MFWATLSLMKLVVTLSIVLFTGCTSQPKSGGIHKVESAFNEYLAASAANEVDQIGGTITAAARKSALTKGFAEILAAAEAKTGYVAAFREAKEKELKAAYDKALQDFPNRSSDVTVFADGIRDTQQIWIQYREAWIAYAKDQYPAYSSADLAARLNEQRTKEIRSIGE